MTSNASIDSARTFTAWVTIVGAVLACADIYCFTAATGGDFELLFRPAEALALPAAAQRLFVLANLADSFGFYLPFLVIGGYYWSTLRDHGRVLMNMAALCITVYVLLGLAGTAMQIAAYPPLAAAHAGGDAMVKAATEATWLGIVHATERGLWAMEGPVMAFWGIVVGNVLRREGDKGGYILLLAGGLYGLLFALQAAGADAIVNSLEPIALLAVIVWMFQTGVALLRAR